MDTLICPKCSKGFVRRAGRRGFFEKCLSLFYIFPFRCQLCGHRFKRLQWGSVYHKTVYEIHELEQVPVYLNVSISTEKGEHCSGALRTLCLQGCSLSGSQDLDEESIFRLELHVPNSAQPIVIDAAASRKREGDQEQMDFLRVDHQQRERLRAFIKELHATLQIESKDKTIAA